MGSIGLRDCAEGRSVVSSVSGVGFAFDDGGLRKGDRTCDELRLNVCERREGRLDY